MQVLAVVCQALASPSLPDDRKRLLKPFPTLFDWNIVGREHAWCRAPAHSQFQASTAEDVNRGCLLGDFQWVVQGQQGDGGAQADALGALGRRRQDGQR